MAMRRACSLLTREQMLEGKVPTTATSASIVAAMQVQEAVKLLHQDRLATGFAGRGVAYNGLTHDSYTVTYGRNEDCLSHDTYDLSGAIDLAADVTFAELLRQATEQLGDAAVIELEREIVTTMTCPQCATTRDGYVPADVYKPLDTLTVGAALCPFCGAERQLEFTHAVAPGDATVLALTPQELGLPPYDIVTARARHTRMHFLLGGEIELLAGRDPR
jgi:adenylyltransferase/sulfurtransferase